MSVALRTSARYAASASRPLGRDDLGGQRGVGGDHHEGGAVQRVRAGGEDGDGARRAVGELDVEVDVGALGATDPVALHGQHPVRPGALELLHVVEQPLGVVGDLEVPLVQLALGHLGAAALAHALHDLLVGQHGLVVGAPVDRAVLAVGQAPLAELQEQPLGPAVVLRVGGVQPVRPVEGDRVATERLRLGLDVGVGVDRRVLVVLDRGVLGGQTEGVPADRVQHVEALLPPVARDDVVQRHHLGVAHVQVAGGVGEHRQRVALLRALGRRPGAELVELVPYRAPLVLDRGDVVGHGLLLGGLTRAVRVSGGLLAHLVLSSAGGSPAACWESGARPGHKKAPRARGAAASGRACSTRLAKEQGPAHACHGNAPGEDPRHRGTPRSRRRPHPDRTRTCSHLR